MLSGEEHNCCDYAQVDFLLNNEEGEPHPVKVKMLEETAHCSVCQKKLTIGEIRAHWHKQLGMTT